MRMKHGSDRGPTISVKPRLLAAFTAVAMMFATAVPALLPKTAVAVDTYTDVGGTCKPSTGSIGDISANGTEDKGVATWVGRDMYIGDKPVDQDSPVELGGMTGTKPKGSYAVEAEGLTLVRGKLAINQVKNSWEYSKKFPGFRFGAVGFGGNFRPASGNTALAVAGQDSLITKMYGDAGGNGTGWIASDTSVGAWTHGGWVGGSVSNNQVTEPRFTASLKGWTTKWASNNNNASIANNQAGGTNFSQIPGPTDENFWNKPAPFTLTYTSPTTPDGVTTNYLNYKDGKDYGQVIAGQSKQLSRLEQTTGASVSTGTATGEITRLRYNHDGGTTKIGVKIDNDKNNEKVVKFTGDNDPTHTMQVFNIDASILSSAGYSGTSFEFDKIPVISTYTVNGQTHNVYASVVVNVDGTNVDFHNGWNFKWNGEDIGDGYVNGSDNAPKYNDAASSIMWNFYNADRVAIRGGMIKADSGKWASSDESISVRSSQSGYENYITSDDPAAAMLGSIMVPKGTFDDHVTTNGRVWVGKDFMMNSPYVLKNGNDSWIPGDVTDNEKTPTASIIAMDMERHNFGWSASINTACSVIAWNKVNQSGDSLGGTSWGIYKTADAAAKRVTQFDQGLIRYVTDNDMSTDQDSDTAGRIEINNLKSEANYYIRELDTHNSQYELNPYIYKIEAGPDKNVNPTGNPYKTIAAVYKVTDATTGAVDEITGSDEAKQLLDGKIVNKSSGFDIEWGKTESGKTEGLEGSEWILSQGENQWVVRDDGTPINSITITHNNDSVENITQAQGTTITGLKAVIDPAEANQKVTWSAAPEGYVDVVQMENGTTSVLLRGRPDDGQVVLTATAADGKTDSVTITITAPQVKSFEITPESATIQVRQTQQFTAVVKDANDQELDVTPSWSVQDSAVAEIASDGTVTGKAAGSTKVYAEFGGQRREATITITAAPVPQTKIYAYMHKDWANPYLYVWSPGLSGKWPGEHMTKDSTRPTADSNYNWYYLDVLTTNGFSFKISNNGQWETREASISAGGGEYDVTNIKGDQVPTVTNTKQRSIALASPSKRMMASRATAAPAWAPVDTTDWTVDNGKAKNDDNPATGKFKVSGLKPGKYTLKENKAPEDYFVNPTEYEIDIAEDGKVTWDPEPKKDSNGLHWIEDVPTEFSWTKVDAGYSPNNTDAKRNPIAGSKWRLEKFKAPATAGAEGTYETNIAEIKDCTSDDQSGCAIDKDSDAGKFKLTGLALGKYRLVEKEAPQGYAKLDTYYYFELNTKDPENPIPEKWTAGDENSWDKQTGSYKGTATSSSPSKSEKAVEINAAPNYRETGSVNWSKVDAEDNSKVLGGSEWKIRFKAEGDTAFGDYYTVIDCASTPAECSVPGKPDNQPNWTYDRHSTSGWFQLRDLQWGTYELVETKAPDGYNLSTETYTFTVSRSNVNTNIAITGTGVSDNKIPNEPGFELPATGGEGNTLIPLLGVALTAISMLGCAIAMRKRI